jgi:hypothetical protein
MTYPYWGIKFPVGLLRFYIALIDFEEYFRIIRSFKTSIMFKLSTYALDVSNLIATNAGKFAKCDRREHFANLLVRRCCGCPKATLLFNPKRPGEIILQMYDLRSY